MSLAVALGANLWILAAAVPIGLAHAWGLAPVALVGLGALGIGAHRRSGVGLLMIFPLLAVAPQLLSGALRVPTIQTRTAFVLGAASLVGYLCAAAYALSRAPSAEPQRKRPLPLPPLPVYWQRRLRVYGVLVALCAVVPAALLGVCDLWPASTRALEESYGGQLAPARAFLTAAAGVLWIALFRSALLSPLAAHLDHDRDLHAAVARARRQARRGRTRPVFYLAVVLALASMLALVLLRGF